MSSLIDKIREVTPESSDKESFKERFKEFYKAQHERACNQRRQLWFGYSALKSLHESMGDEQFKNMLESAEIVTNTKGAEYINKFEEEYVD